jgi:hypothetical protein
VGFVLFGYGAVLAGGPLGWRWVRNRTFRTLHLAAIALVALESLLGWVCPLTWLEGALRERRGAGTFVGRLVHAVLFYDLPHGVFTAAYLLAVALALALWWMAPPRPRKPRRPRDGAAPGRSG